MLFMSFLDSPGHGGRKPLQVLKPEVKVFYEPDTHTVCSVVRDPSSRKAGRMNVDLLMPRVELESL